jgi:hypothetical protein
MLCAKQNNTLTPRYAGLWILLNSLLVVSDVVTAFSVSDVLAVVSYHIPCEHKQFHIAKTIQLYL